MSLLDTIGARSGVSLEELLGQDRDECDVRHVLRLAKYGLVDIAAS